MLFFAKVFSYEKTLDFMRAESSSARLLLKVLKEIYEVLAVALLQLQAS